MKMIKIAALENGAHRNQTYNGFLPDGWAIVLVETDTLENFPYGNFKTADANGLVYMDATTWTPLPMPEPDPVSEPEPKPKPAGPTLNERVTDLESALAATDETAIELYEAMAAQEEINTAQDEALIAIYEMIGG